MIGCKPLCFFGEVPPRQERTKKKPYAGGNRAGTACGQTDTEEEPGKLAERTSQSFVCQVVRRKSAERCGSPAATSKGTGLLKHRPSRQARPALCAGQGRQPCPVDVMPCVISYWVLSALSPIRCKTLLDGGRRRTKNLYGVFKRTVPAGQVRQ